GIGGLGNDDVVLSWTEFQHGARVLRPDFGESVGQHATIPTFEESRGADDWFTILRNRQMANGMTRYRRCGNAAANAQDEHVRAVRSRQHRQMAYEQLRAEIGSRRGVGVAID